MPSPKKLRSLENPLKEQIWRMHQARLGYPPIEVTCDFLQHGNLVICIERSRSATEQFLLKQEKLQLAQEVGTAINQILKSEISEILVDKFGLTVVEASFLTPTMIEKFSLWIVINVEASVKEDRPGRLDRNSRTNARDNKIT